MKFSTSLLCVLPAIGLVATSCSTADDTPSTSAASPSLTSAETPKNLSLTNACALAVKHHPSLATYPMDRRAADARILQATRLPNPTLTVDAEDLLGAGSVSGLGAAMINTLFTQVIQRGGKRQANTEAAQSSGKVMDAQYEVLRRQVIRETGELYLDAVAARENVSFLEATLKRSKETSALVAQLVEAGRVTIGSVQQAKLEVQKTELALASARKASERASRALTAQWGDSRPTLVTNGGLAAPPGTLGSKSSQKAGLSKHPKILYSQAKVEQSEALLKVARANSRGNATLGGGFRQANATDEPSALLSVSLPLPIFNKRQDAIVQMTALFEKARTELAGAERALGTEFSLAWSDLVSTHQTARKIESDLLPTSSELFKSAEESFRAGKITSLEYLAAQQQFQNIRSQWLTARREYQISAARVQALTNRSL